MVPSGGCSRPGSTLHSGQHDKTFANAAIAGPLLAQTSTSTSTSSYGQTVHLTRSEQQVETHLTRIIARVSGGPNLYDKTLNLPITAPDVQTTFAEATW